MDLDAIRKIEQIALSDEVCGYKRAFSSGISLMTYARLRFTEVNFYGRLV